ncbi:hypothetical protein EXIGLDRAFT_196418 [Exidia glandulosa HHB12029]|uniref:Uncharacterized protein n=1 Tax=Exidia glandulosa HHB12029 TaxID=1314781 RepID=A0A165EU67_EXIGL|nr:hypothetical protein EXIGLDRAFT_196418 [Exidia glandulosa HHB12029]
MRHVGADDVPHVARHSAVRLDDVQNQSRRPGPALARDANFLPPADATCKSLHRSTAYLASRSHRLRSSNTSASMTRSESMFRVALACCRLSPAGGFDPCDTSAPMHNFARAVKRPNAIRRLTRLPRTAGGSTRSRKPSAVRRPVACTRTLLTRRASRLLNHASGRRNERARPNGECT